MSRVKQKGPRQFFDQAAFRAAFRGGKVPAVRAPFAGVELKADANGKFSFIMSTADTDRMGDTIQQDGWDLASFVKNPVMQWAHNYGMPPVGKVGRSLVENGNLVARDVEFQAREVFEFGWSVGQMYLQKFLNAVSVGFQPTVLEWKSDDSGGIEFQKQELLELSAVPVPANPNALQLAKSAGLLVPAWKGWAESFLDVDSNRADRGNPTLRAALDVYELMAPPAVAVKGVGDGDEEMPEVQALTKALDEHRAVMVGHCALLADSIAAKHVNTEAVRALTAKLSEQDAAKSADNQSDRIAALVLSQLKT